MRILNLTLLIEDVDRREAIRLKKEEDMGTMGRMNGTMRVNQTKRMKSLRHNVHLRKEVPIETLWM